MSFKNSINLTKQSFKDEVNVNSIMAKYHATGHITHLNKNPAQYGDFSQVSSLQEAIEKIDNARKTFQELPSELRSQFDNSPAQFIEFAQNADIEQLNAVGIYFPNQQSVKTENITGVVPPNQHSEASPEQAVDTASDQSIS